MLRLLIAFAPSVAAFAVGPMRLPSQVRSSGVSMEAAVAPDTELASVTLSNAAGDSAKIYTLGTQRAIHHSVQAPPVPQGKHKARSRPEGDPDAMRWAGTV